MGHPVLSVLWCLDIACLVLQIRLPYYPSWYGQRVLTPVFSGAGNVTQSCHEVYKAMPTGRCSTVHHSSLQSYTNTSHHRSSTHTSHFKAITLAQPSPCVSSSSSQLFLLALSLLCPTHYLKATADPAQRTIVVSTASSAEVFALDGHPPTQH